MNMKKWMTGALAFAMTAGVATTSLAASPAAATPNERPTAKQIEQMKANRSKAEAIHKQIQAKFVEFGWVDASTAAKMQERAGQRIVHRSTGPQKKILFQGDRQQGRAPMLVLIREKLQNATPEQRAEIAALRGQLQELRAQRPDNGQDCDRPMPRHGKMIGIRAEKGTE